MATSRPINLLIAGVGGQGVLSLTRVIWRLCERAGWRCQGSTFKGGAQTLGSIHSVLRIFPGPREPGHAIHSVEVLPGDLDLLVGLEAWETLRYQAQLGERSKIYMNTAVSPLLSARYRRWSTDDPLAAVRSLGHPLVARDYTAQAVAEFQSPRMLNFVLGREVITAGDLPFDLAQFTLVFSESVRLDPAARALLSRPQPKSLHPQTHLSQPDTRT